MIEFSYDQGNKRAVITGDDDVVARVREYFSYENPGAKFARRIGRFIPERTYLITPTCRFDEGLTHTIKDYIEKEFNGVSISVSQELETRLKPKFIDNLSTELTLKLRDYQKDIVNSCLQHGRGVVLLATAGGKTLTFATLLENLYQLIDKKDIWKVLVVVPDLGLVNQTYDDFVKYGVNFTFSKWTGNNELNLGSNVIIANLGILQSKNTDTEWIKYVDTLIIDEVHKLRKDNKINKLIKSVKTVHKFGFTGTLPEELPDQYNIIGKIGPVLYEKRSYELRDDKYITTAEALIFNISYNILPNYGSMDLVDPGVWYRAEQEFITGNIFRNQLIGKFCNGIKNNTLILVDLIKHGETIFSTLKEMCPSKQVFFIQGEVEVSERDKVKQMMEQQDNIICIAISKIFSTGISINNIHYIIFASGGKAKVKILQSIGRGLRLHENKNKLVLVDIADQLKYGGDHSDRRLELYKNERILVKTHNFQEKI